VDICVLTDEWDDMVDYAKQYINLTLDYKEFFNSPAAKQ